MGRRVEVTGSLVDCCVYVHIRLSVGAQGFRGNVMIGYHSSQPTFCPVAIPTLGTFYDWEGSHVPRLHHYGRFHQCP